jgi:hypothetical protein
MHILLTFNCTSSVDSAALEREGGPGAPSDDTPPLPPFDTLVGNDIDNIVKLGQLEALLLGRDYALASPRYSKFVEEQGGGRCVDAVFDTLHAALADADDSRLAAVAIPWSQIEEFYGQADPDELADWLREFAALARRARDRSERLYCSA